MNIPPNKICTDRKYVLYFHERGTDGSVFYVGIGSKDRAYNKRSRNLYWERTVHKYGYRVRIVAEDLTWNEACNLEIFFISEFGRSKYGGKLVNMTDGGEGTLGFKPKHSESVLKCDKITKKVIKRYESIAECSRESGISKTTLYSSIKRGDGVFGYFVYILGSETTPKHFVVSEESDSLKESAELPECKICLDGKSTDRDTLLFFTVVILFILILCVFVLIYKLFNA